MVIPPFKNSTPINVECCYTHPFQLIGVAFDFTVYVYALHNYIIIN